MTTLNKADFGFDQPPNYSSHAIEFLRQTAEVFREGGLPPDWEEFLAMALVDSVKFLLPESGYLFADHDYSPKMFELQRLPYPICALEFRAGEELYAEGSGLMHATKRIALCFDPHRLSPLLASLFGKLIKQPMSQLPQHCMAVTAVYFADDIWGSAVGFVVVDLDDDKPILMSDQASINEGGIQAHDIISRAGGRVLGTGTKHGLPSTFFTIPERARLVGQSAAEAYEALYIDSIDEVRVTYEFLAAINCSNVGSLDIPAPAKLNQKRAKSGKTPFFPYKVLDLSVSESQPGAGGGGASPRSHLRRGHLRRLGEKFGNKILWINATMVNSAANSPIAAVYKVRQ